jgi:hypothetical protein
MLLLATVGALVLRLVHEGMRQAESAGWLRMLIIVAFALCSAMAFTRTWSSYTRPLDSRAEEHSFRSIKVIGFLGVLLAYAVRSAVEAAGYDSLIEVEIFSELDWWRRDPDEVLRIMAERYRTVV